MNANHTILLIDDDADDVELLKDALKENGNGFHVVEAHDGEDGLEKLYELYRQGDIPCLIVMDVNMPKMDGRRTFTKIKSDTRFSSVPIVIFSTSAKEANEEFFALRNTRCMTKPINFNKLVQIAANMLSICKIHTKNA